MALGYSGSSFGMSLLSLMFLECTVTAQVEVREVVGTCCRGSLLETGSQDLAATVKTEVKDRIAKRLLSQYVSGFWDLFTP